MLEDSELEQRFLDFVFTTEATITVGAVAYFAKCSLQQAEALLDRLASDGTLRIESTDGGDIFYVYPNRGRLERSKAIIPTGQRAIVAAPGSGPPSMIAPPAPARAAQPMMVIGGPSVPAPIPERPSGEALAAGGNQVCPFCGEAILAVAKKCKHCGEMLDPTLRAAQVDRIQVNVGMQHVQPGQVPYDPTARHVSPGVAAVLSFVWPGAGHLYANKIGTGLAWMAGTFLGYVALIVPGIILHVLCIFAAAGTARAENRRTGAL